MLGRRTPLRPWRQIGHGPCASLLPSPGLALVTEGRLAEEIHGVMSQDVWRMPVPPPGARAQRRPCAVPLIVPARPGRRILCVSSFDEQIHLCSVPGLCIFQCPVGRLRPATGRSFRDSSA
jgi:hypothetical protein